MRQRADLDLAIEAMARYAGSGLVARGDTLFGKITARLAERAAADDAEGELAA